MKTYKLNLEYLVTVPSGVTIEHIENHPFDYLDAYQAESTEVNTLLLNEDDNEQLDLFH